MLTLVALGALFSSFDEGKVIKSFPKDQILENILTFIIFLGINPLIPIIIII